MHLLLTGGTGFFGKSLLRHWISKSNCEEIPQSVTVLTRSPENFCAQYPELTRVSWLQFHRGDILNPASLPQSGRFTHLLHAAADSTFGPKLSPLQRYTQIVDGTRLMLDYATKNGIGRFLLTSSGGVYGPQPQEMLQIAENFNGMPDPLNPLHAYSIAKRCAEHLCTLYRDSYGIETVVARCFAFAGRDLPLDVHFAIGNFVRDALLNPEITVAGDGTPLRSYMDQRDLAHWLMTLLVNGKSGEAYNVGSDVAITIENLACKVRDIIAPSKPVRILAEVADENFRNRYIPSIQKAHAELGLSLTYTLDDIIRATAMRC